MFFYFIKKTYCSDFSTTTAPLKNKMIILKNIIWPRQASLFCHAFVFSFFKKTFLHPMFV
jgi:hypothetical protein